MRTNFNAKQAYIVAVRYSNLTKHDLKLLFIEQEEGLYHMIIHATFLNYEFYVDSTTGEVLGVSTTPTLEDDGEEYSAIA